MKKFSQAIALVAVTTLFATAFTTINVDHKTTDMKAIPAQAELNVPQVVIVGKRMSVLEKAQYDVEMLAQNQTQPTKTEQSELHIAIK
ncbi:hypothetical protein [Solimicrobium silvestre]|uniref:Uncharacterized protein n=1 Tax=Solimicrobium silvestre TaxID=2099400 RepID=A0A2S9GV96_9BURK|nr:hypothetical protein [Solimicrobium silvestre]PRC91634.1 hypothetical protein S2091_3572 [Solimicrobium silvestre]